VLPNFLIIGSMKSGTTSLWTYMRHHPDVFFPVEKEPSFFVPSLNWERGIEWYESLYEGSEARAARGEASTNYTKLHRFPGVAPLIQSLIPDVKLIYLMRNPIDRMISHYLHMRATGHETLSAERAFLEHPTYLDTSRYSWQIREYIDRFPQQNLLFITSESLRENRQDTLRRVFSFLGVDPDVALAMPARTTHATADKSIRVLTAARAERSGVYRAIRRITPTAGRRLYHRVSTRSMKVASVRISDGLRERLAEVLRPEVEALVPRMPEDFDGWGLLGSSNQQRPVVDLTDGALARMDQMESELPVQ
jgi:sulfotransferase family protein